MVRRSEKTLLLVWSISQLSHPPYCDIQDTLARNYSAHWPLLSKPSSSYPQFHTTYVYSGNLFCVWIFSLKYLLPVQTAANPIPFIQPLFEDKLQEMENQWIV